MQAPRSLAPFLLLCLIGFATLFSSYLRIPVLPLFAASLGASPAQVGTINGAFMLTAGLFSIPAGVLADRTGRRLPIVAGILAMAASSFLITLCRLPGQMAAAYVFFGAGLAAFAPAMLSLVADVMPPERLGRAYGWYTTATYIAMTLGPASGGFLAKALGFRQLFMVSGCLLLGVALVALPLLPSGPPRRRSALRGVLAGSVELARDRRLVACLLTTLACCAGFGVFLTFLPLHASSRGHDPGRVGLVFAAQAVTNVVSRIPIGALVDRHDRRPIVSAGLVCLAAALAALGQQERFPPLVGCAVFMGVGMALTFTTVGAMIADLAPPQRRGLAMGMYNSCIYLGMMAGSTLLGLALKRIGYGPGFGAAGGVVLAGLFLFLGMTGRERRAA